VDVAVTGIGLRCCLGSLTESWQRLLAGDSGLKIHQPFPELPPQPLGLIGDRLTSLAGLTQLLVADALADAGLEPPLPDCGIAIGSSRGCQGIWEQLARQWHQEKSVSLAEIGAILPHQAAIAAARQIGSCGPALSPMAACATGIWAIAQGAELIRQGRCNRVLAGAVETPITPLALAGFQQMGALAATGCYPFDRQRQGLVLSEGGAIFLLERADLARQRGAAIYGQVLAAGLTCDAYHVSAPAPDNRSAIAAVKQCLAASNLSASQIDYIHPHGTGTRLNDGREAQLIQLLFPQGVPVSSTKGATGHTLGASGAIGSAFCLLALKHQQLPPCVGLKHPEFPLNFLWKARQTRVSRTLCLSFGFGGQNAALCWGIAPD
jgi:3-oxoacyl-[acyl-carrier-protein] synthase II